MKAPPDPREQTLLDAAKRGDRSAFDELVREHRLFPRACGAAWFFAGRDAEWAEDAAQEALLIAWRKLPKWTPRAPFASWVCAIARNRARSIRHVRDRYVQVKDEEQELSDRLVDPIDEHASLVARRGLAVELREAQSLPLEERSAWVMHRWLGRTAPEIAAKMELPVRRVDSLLRSARRRLELGAEEPGPEVAAEAPPTSPRTESKRRRRRFSQMRGLALQRKSRPQPKAESEPASSQESPR